MSRYSLIFFLPLFLCVLAPDFKETFRAALEPCFLIPFLSTVFAQLQRAIRCEEFLAAFAYLSL